MVKFQRILRYLLSLSAGVGLSFAFAPTNLGWLAWFFPAALLAILWSCPRQKGRKGFWQGFRLAFLAGFGFWVRDVWFVGAVSAQGGWISSSALALYLSCFFGVYGGWAITIGRPTPIKPRSQPALAILRLSVIHGFLWCGIEWLRGLSNVSFGWDGLGVSFVDSGLVLAQAADLVGVNGLSFIPAFGGAVLVQTIMAFHNEAFHGYRRVQWEVIVTMTLLCLTFSYGALQMKMLRGVEKFPVRSLLVQQNIPLSLNFSQEKVEVIARSFSNEMQSSCDSITERVVKDLQETGEAKISMPDMVVWPESSFPFANTVDSERKLLPEQRNESFFNHVVRSHGDFLFISGVNEFPTINEGNGMKWDYSQPFYNSIGFFPEGFESYVGRPKSHLMPFGEYMPLANLAFVQKIYESAAGQEFGGAFSPGTKFEPYHTEVKGEFLSIIPSVCYEDSVSSVVRNYIRPEPQMIVNVTNDGWFAGTNCAEKHFQNARYRAIEYRRPLIRAANSGMSGVINIIGTLEHPETGKPQVIRDVKTGAIEIKGSLEGLVEVPKKPIQTVYASVGHMFCWVVGLIALSYTGFIIIQNKRAS